MKANIALSIVCVSLVVTSMSCTKRSDGESPKLQETIDATPATVESGPDVVNEDNALAEVKQSEVINNTTSAILALGDKKYAVLPPEHVEANIPFNHHNYHDNVVICRKMYQVKNAIQTLEEESRASAQGVQYDLAFEGKVDELAMAIEEKKAELEALESEKLEMDFVINTNPVSSNLLKLKRDNPNASFELADLSHVQISANEGRLTEAVQEIQIEKNKMNYGTRNIHLMLGVNHKVLCSAMNYSQEITLKF